MVDEALKTLLCLLGKHKSYAVGFPYAEGIYKGTMISPMPCLPGHFADVCSYKGSIVLVVCQEDSASDGEEAKVRQIVLVLHHQKYFLGILLYQELYLIQIGVNKQIKGPEQQESDLWIERAYFMWNGSLYSLIDAEKALEGPIIFE